MSKLLELGLQPIAKTFRPTSDAYLARLEAEMGTALPNDFRAFTQQYGACTFAEYVCFAMPGGPLVDVSSFFGSDPDDSYDLGQVFRTMKERSPQPVLPFACDPHGNALCLDLREQSFGQVVFWDHETEVANFVATSFDTFIAMLRRDG